MVSREGGTSGPFGARKFSRTPEMTRMVAIASTDAPLPGRGTLGVCEAMTAATRTNMAKA
jgi:hypothetical protein